MSVEAVLGVVAFGGMFLVWAVVPSILKRRHSPKVEEETRSSMRTSLEN